MFLDKVFKDHPSLGKRTRSHVVLGLELLKLVETKDYLIEALKDYLRMMDLKRLQKVTNRHAYHGTNDIDMIRNSVVRAVLESEYRHQHTEYLLSQAFTQASAYLTWSGGLSRQKATEKLAELFWSVYPRPEKLREGLKYELVLHWKGMGYLPFNQTALRVLIGIVNSEVWEDGPILADALEDSGFYDQDILIALRSDRLFEGHWVYDLLTGKGYTDAYRLKVTVRGAPFKDVEDT